MNPSRRIGNSTVGRWLLIVAMLLAVAVCPAARADNVTVSASLVDPSVDAGQPAEYHIDVSNGRLDHPPPAPPVDGLTITYKGPYETRQLSFGFGTGMQDTIRTTYIYAVETSRPGRFVIPGQQVEVDGTTLRTLPVTLEVMGAGAAGGAPPGQAVSAELIIPKTSVYVGESFPVDLRTSFGQNITIRQADADPMLDGEGFSAQKFTRPRGDMREVNGSPVTVITYKTAVTGVKTGQLTVGPVTTMPVVVLPRARPTRRRSFNDPFSDPFFGDPFGQFNAPPKQIKLTSNSVNVEVKGLPPGKPADFSGAIGDFKLEAEADPRKAQAGDPVTVRLMLSGRGNFDRIAAPVLSDDHGLRTYPATSRFKADDEVNLSGVKTFEQVVIADGARTSLPAYHLTYLDPATGKYATLDTPPIPVEIIGGSTPAPTPAASAVSDPAVTPATTPTPTPTPKPAEDILYIRTDPGPARTASDFLPPYRRRLGSPFWLAQWIALAALLAVPVAAGVVARARNEKARRLAQARRQQAELQRALQQENTGRAQFYSAATQLARLRAATAAGQPASSLSVADICRARGLDARAAGSVEEIFHRHDELAYSGGRAAQEPVPADERRGVLATLETLQNR